MNSRKSQTEPERIPRCRARVGGLCGFRGTAGKVPTTRHKTGRCANVWELKKAK